MSGSNVAGGPSVPERHSGEARNGAEAPPASGSGPSEREPAGNPPTITTPMVVLAWQISEHPGRYHQDARVLARLILEATGDLPVHEEGAVTEHIGTPLIYEGDRVEMTTGHPFRGIVNTKQYSESGYSFWVLWDDHFPEEGPYAERDLRLVRRGSR